MTKQIRTSIVAVLEVRPPLKIPSINQLWKPKVVRAGKRVFGGLYKDTKVRDFQAELIRQAKLSELVKAKNFSFDYVNVTYAFLLDKNFYKRDVSNMIKMTEDALMEVTDIDDSKHHKVVAIKALSYIDDIEYIVCKYEFVKNENE